MKIEYKVYCHEHTEEQKIVDVDAGPSPEKKMLPWQAVYVKPCSQCQSEAYEKGIESVLSKGYNRNEGEI